MIEESDKKKDNNLAPQGVLELPSHIEDFSDEEIQRIYERFIDKYRGPNDP